MNINKVIDPPNLILEFLEVAIHCVLYSRKLYPDGIFTLKKKYGVPIHVSMYPDLNDYILESLKAVKDVLLKNELKQIDIYFYNRLAKPIERFIFKINNLQQNIKDIENQDLYLLKLKELFRSFCLKLSVNNSYMKPLPEDANFKIAIHTSENASVSLSEDPQYQQMTNGTSLIALRSTDEISLQQDISLSLKFPWIEAEKVDIVIDNAKLIPLRTIEHNLFNIHIYSEESETK